jgi:hypothetical protein
VLLLLLVLMLFLMLLLGFVVMLGLKFPEMLELLLVVTSGEAGFRPTLSGTDGTHPGTALRARQRCRWLMVVRD